MRHQRRGHLNATLGWCRDHRIDWRLKILGKPLQNGFVDSFHGPLLNEK